MNNKTVLCVMAHPDDAEILSGGTLALLAANGWKVVIASMTPGQAGSVQLNPDEISAVRRGEAANAAAVIGAEYYCLESEDVFITYDKPTLLRVIALFRQVQPTLVITASPDDYMLDHEITSHLAQTACMAATIRNIGIPGMIARALAFTGHPEYAVSAAEVDSVYPMLIRNLIPDGLKGLILIGTLATVMSTTAAFLNSISTLFTYDVYKKWINPLADDKKLVKTGVFTTLALMVFSILYAPVIEKFGGIFLYFQAASTYLAVPVATCFLFGAFWRRATPAAALVIMIVGIPLGALIQLVLIPAFFSADTITRYSLTNFYVTGGITQFFCALLMIGVSWRTTPRPLAEIQELLWKPAMLYLPSGEQQRPLWQSVGFWWGVMAVIYGTLYILLW